MATSVLYNPHAHATNGKADGGTSETRKIKSLLEKFAVKRLSILERYRILRVHHKWTIFQAIRFALWLAR
jgi:hypothetical protein